MTQVATVRNQGALLTGSHYASGPFTPIQFVYQHPFRYLRIGVSPREGCKGDLVYTIQSHECRLNYR